MKYAPLLLSLVMSSNYVNTGLEKDVFKKYYVGASLYVVGLTVACGVRLLQAKPITDDPDYVLYFKELCKQQETLNDGYEDSNVNPR